MAGDAELTERVCILVTHTSRNWYIDLYIVYCYKVHLLHMYRYTKYIPKMLRGTHNIHKSSAEGNSCLFNSTSQLLFSNGDRTWFLRLATVLAGALAKDQIVNTVNL